MQLAIYFEDPTRAAAGAQPPRGLLAKFRAVSRYKQNPRDEAYMRRLAAQVLGPELHFLDARAGIDPAAVNGAAHVTLLWPDGSGLGWSQIERQIARYRGSFDETWVLNGRQRHFRLSRSALLAFRTRRLLERSWIGEAACFFAVLVLGTALATWDLVVRAE